MSFNIIAYLTRRNLAILESLQQDPELVSVDDTCKELKSLEPDCQLARDGHASDTTCGGPPSMRISPFPSRSADLKREIISSVQLLRVWLP